LGTVGPDGRAVPLESTRDESVRGGSSASPREPGRGGSTSACQRLFCAMPYQALPGFRDFPPEELAFRNHITAAWRRVATRYGFTEYDGPPLEPLELYTAKSGDEIVTQLFE